jgi:alanine dehydrogenase
MTIGIFKECGNENRVAILPGEVCALKKLNIDVLAENHAGERAYSSRSIDGLEERPDSEIRNVVVS